MMPAPYPMVPCITCTEDTAQETAWHVGSGLYLCPDCRWKHLETPAAPKGEVIDLRERFYQQPKDFAAANFVAPVVVAIAITLCLLRDLLP